MLDINAVDIGFSRKAELYDAYCANHPVIQWARNQIREQVMGCIPLGASILELNAGTGSDAVEFVKCGYRVHATDIASGMIAAIDLKIQKLSGDRKLTVQKISFTDLEHVTGGPFDLVFSNFGGLNCIPDLRDSTRSFSKILKPGGYVVWVIMPPFCPWELAQLARGKFRAATRRLHADGVLANVEGAQVRTWYHSAKSVRNSFPPEFELIHKQAISLFCPPSYMDKFFARLPRLTQFLLRLDERLGQGAPFYNWGDFVVYTFRHER